jgi:hypothetical protein
VPVSMIRRHATSRSGNIPKHADTIGFSIVCLCGALVGAAWWASDANRVRGRVLVVLGLLGVVAGRFADKRLTKVGHRILWGVVIVLTLLTVVEARHAIQVIHFWREVHLL